MLDKLRHHWNVSTRREFFTRAGSGLAGIALANLLAEDGLRYYAPDARSAGAEEAAPSTDGEIRDLAVHGGRPEPCRPFDPKPLLTKLDGKPIPDSIGKPKQTSRGTGDNALMASKRTWKQYGESGMWVSDWYKNVAAHVDEMTVIRSCWADGLNHVGSVCQMNTGSILAGRPSLGAWVTYGLGTANKNLPVLCGVHRRSRSSGRLEQLEFRLPARRLPGHTVPPRRYADSRSEAAAGINDQQQRNQLGLLKSLNEIWSRDKQDDSELDARIRSYELAYQMQSAASEAVDLSKESEATKKMYGIDDAATSVTAPTA